MEVHIFGELTWENLNKVTLTQPLTTAEEQDDWLTGRKKLNGRGVTIVDTVYP